MTDLNLAMTIRLMDRATAPLRGIGRAMQGFGRQARDVSGSLGRLKQQQGTITAFRQLKERLDQAGTAMTTAKARAEGLGRELAQARRRAGTLETGLREAEVEVERLGREMRAAEAPSEQLQAAFREAEQKAEALRAELRGTGRDIERLETAFDTARTAARRTADGHRTLASRTEHARRSMREAGLSAGRLADSQRQVTRQTREATEAMARQAERAAALQRRTEALARARDRLAKATMVGAGVGASGYAVQHAGRMGLGLAQPAMKADHAWTSLRMVAGVDEEDMRAMQARVAAIARQTNQDAMALRDALGFLIGKGLDPTEALAALTRVGISATGTGADIADMGALTFAAMDTLKVAARDMAKAHDIMARAGDLGGFELRDMARTFPQLTASARALGLTGTQAIGTLSAALQVAVKGASSPDEAANNLANFLQKATAPETVRNFAKFGIDIKAALGEAVARGDNPFDALITQIAKATGADLEQEISQAVAAGADPRAAAEALAQKFQLGELFGDMQVLNFLAPMLANMNEFRRIRAEALGADGVVDDKFNTMMGTTGEQVKALTIAMGGLRDAAGRAMLTALGTIAQRLTGVVNRITDWTKANPKLTATLGKLAAYAAAGAVGVGGLLTAVGAVIVPFAILRFSASVLGIRLLGLGTILRGVGRAGPLVAGGFRRIGSALRAVARAGPLVAGGFRLMGAALMTTPIGWVAALALLLAGAAFAIYRNWDKIGAWFQGKVDRVKAAFDEGLIQGVMALVAEFNPWSVVLEGWDGLIKWLFGIDLAEVGRQWMDSIGKGFAEGWKSLTDWLDQKIKDLTGMLPAFVREGLGLGEGDDDSDDDQASAPRPARDQRGRLILPGSVAAATVAGAMSAAVPAGATGLAAFPAPTVASITAPAPDTPPDWQVVADWGRRQGGDTAATGTGLAETGRAMAALAEAGRTDLPLIPAVPATGPAPAVGGPQPVIPAEAGPTTNNVDNSTVVSVTVPPGSDINAIVAAVTRELERRQRGALHDLQ